MKISFRLKTILSIILIQTVMLLALVWSSLNYLTESNIDEFNLRTSTATRLFATTVKDAVLASNLATLESHISELMSNPGIVYVRVKDLQMVIAERGDTKFLLREYKADTAYALVDDGVYDTHAHLKEGSYIFGQVEIGFSTDHINNVIQQARQHISSIALFEVILIAIIATILMTFLTKQLSALQGAVNAVRRLGPGSQIKVTGHDELAQTAIAFNAMSTELKKTYDSLREAIQLSHYQKEKVDALFNNVPSGIALVNEAGIILSANRSMAKLFNLNKSKLENMPMSEVLQKWDKIFDHHQPSGYTYNSAKYKGWDESNIIRKDGTLIPVHVSITYIHFDTERQYIIVLRDISDHVYNEKQLSQSNDMLIESISTLEVKNAKMLLLNQLSSQLQKCVKPEEAYHNIAVYGEKLFPGMKGALYIKRDDEFLYHVIDWGMDVEIVEKLHYTDCWALRGATIHPPSVAEKSAQCNHLKQLPEHPVTADLCIPIIAKGNTLGLLHLRGNKEMAMEVDQAFVNVIREQIRMALYNIYLQNQLHGMSIRDALTGLYNRRIMEESIHREIHRANRNDLDLSVVMLDIDHFKKVNDTLGHSAGDRVLIEVSTLLTKSSRSQDVLCRYGGEEFLLVCPDTDIIAIRKLADKLLLSIRDLNIIHEGKTIKVTSSAGIASFRTHGGNAEKLIELADKALYQAKESGRNRVCMAKSLQKPKLVKYNRKPNT